MVGGHSLGLRYSFECSFLTQDEIFKGLDERSLDGVQFSIYADKSNPSEILELYTFAFQYHDAKDRGRRLMGLTAPSHGGATITNLRSITYDMVNLIDQLKNYQHQLPALPSKLPRKLDRIRYTNLILEEERYLMCHLFHSPYALRHHRPSGFSTCTDTEMAFVDNDVWYMKQRSLGFLDSSFHWY